jgi:hypothetical protein
MKKHLLLFIAITFTISAIAQSKYTSCNNKNFSKKATVKNTVDVDIPFLPVLKPHGAQKKAITSIMIGSSTNIYGFLTASQNWLDFNAATNTVMFTHRAGGLWGGSGNDIICKYSTDWFNSAIDSVVFPSDGIQFPRYPGGIIYNPVGNTLATNAFAVICGPSATSTMWSHNYFCSQKLDKTLIDTNYIPMDPILLTLERINLSGGNGNYYILSQDNDGTENLPFVKVRKGAFNSGSSSFDWSLTQTQITKLWGKRVFSNGIVDANFNWNHAWATDGINGYAFCTGIDSLHKYYNGSQLPQIFRTTDGGQTYTAIEPCNYFNNLSNLTDSIWPTMASQTSGGPLQYKPFFRAGSSLDEKNMPGVVDANGDLHMAAIIEGYFSNYVDPNGIIDSSGYSYSNHPTYLFDVIYSAATNSWDIRFIDKIFSANVLETNVASIVSATGNLGWEHCINVSRSEDGATIFFIWTDTDPSFSTDNIIPYIKGRAWNVLSNMATLSKDFVNPIDGGLYYFVNTTDIVAKQGNTFYVPLAYIDVAGDGGLNGDGSQVIYFAPEITFDDTEYTESFPRSTSISSKVEEIFNVSQNYPNPANGTTSFKVTLTEASNVSVEITNMVGQSISVVNKGRLASGSYSINLNTANLESGIYFYTVTIGTQKVTKKMIVE